VLAKMEVEVALGAVLRRLPGLRLAADPADLRFRDYHMVYGLFELPVRWGMADSQK